MIPKRIVIEIPPAEKQKKLVLRKARRDVSVPELIAIVQIENGAVTLFGMGIEASLSNSTPTRIEVQEFPNEPEGAKK